MVSDLQGSRFDPPGEDPALIKLINLLDRKTERLAARQFGDFEVIQHVEHGRPFPPRHVRAVRSDIVPVLGGNGYELLRLHTDRFEKLAIFLFEALEALLRIILQVHLVHQDRDLLDAEQIQQSIFLNPKFSALLPEEVSLIRQVFQNPPTDRGPNATLYDQAKEAVTHGNVMLRDARAGKGSLGKLVTDDTLYNRLRETSTNLATASAKLNDNTTTAGKLFSDPKLYDNLAGLTGDMRLLVGDFRQNPKKFLHIKVTIF